MFSRVFILKILSTKDLFANIHIRGAQLNWFMIAASHFAVSTVKNFLILHKAWSLYDALLPSSLMWLLKVNFLSIFIPNKFTLLQIILTWYISMYQYIYINIYIYLSIFYTSISIYLSVCVCLSVFLSVCPSVRPSVRPSVCLSAFLSIYLSIYLSICLSIHLSIYLDLLHARLNSHYQA